MTKKHVYIFLLICFLLLAGYISMKLFAESKPMSNTEEYLKAHGYVEGQVNEIRLGRVLFRFPAGVKYSPHTNGEIVKGQADSVETGIFYPDHGANNSLKNAVRINLHYGGVEDPKVWDMREEQEEWRKIIQRDDLDLVEYHRKRYDGAWGYITYVARSNNDRTPRGSLIRYVCKGYPDGQIIECWADGYLHKSNVMIWYFINVENLKNWKAIHQEVTNFIDSIIIEE